MTAPPSPGQLTLLLQRSRSGDAEAWEQVSALVYQDLRRIAGAMLRREQSGHTLQPTALVHEAYLKLTQGAPLDPVNRGHLLALAARAMRQVLVEHARRRRAVKRGMGAAPVTLAEDLSGEAMPPDDLLALDEALTRLEQEHPRMRQVVECRFFGGLTEDETAAALGVTARTVQRDWVRARAWLYRDLHGTGASGT